MVRWLQFIRFIGSFSWRQCKCQCKEKIENATSSYIEFHKGRYKIGLPQHRFVMVRIPMPVMVQMKIMLSKQSLKFINFLNHVHRQQPRRPIHHHHNYRWLLDNNRIIHPEQPPLGIFLWNFEQLYVAPQGSRIMSYEFDNSSL